MQKVYQRINWENDPSTNTPINEDNLNKMDYALDKIDDRVVNLSGYESRVAESEKNAKQSEINAKESEINAKESELKAKEYKEQAFSGTPEGYSALLEQVDSIDIKTSSDTTLYNTAPGGYRLTELVGATEQKTLSGKNLFDSSSLLADGAYYSCTNEKCKILQKDARAWTDSALPTLKLEPNTEYTLSVQYACSLYVGFDKAFNSTVKNEKSMTFTTSATGITEFKFLADSYPFDVGYVQIEVGETATPYEPYCGGQPAPNPQYPIAIENTFDCVEMMQGHYIYNTGVYENNSLRVCNKNPIPCKGGDKIGLGMENAEQMVVVYYTDSGYLNFETSADKNQEFVAPSRATKFNFYFFKANGLTVETIGKITLTVNGKYVGQIVDSGKNFLDCSWLTPQTTNGGTFTPTFDEDGRLLYVNVNGTFTANTTYPLLTNPLSLKADEYMFSGCASGGSTSSYYIQSYGTNAYTSGSAILDIGNGFKAKFDTDDVITRSVLTIKSGVTLSNVKFYQMIRKADITDDTYEPYTEKVATFFLSEPLRATDRLVRKDGVHNENHKRGSVVFDGSDDENWQQSIDNYTNKTEGQTRFRIAVAGRKYANKNGMISPMSNIGYVGIINSQATYTDEGVAFYYNSTSSNSENVYVTLNNSAVTDLATFKTWLANNPISIEYDLAEETFTPLDTASQIALNGLETFKDMTHIEVDSKIPPTSISGEYGTSQVGAYTLKAMNVAENNAIKIEDAINTMLLITP